MKTDYNSNLYLTPLSLNSVENKIDEITNNIQEYIFNNETSSLSNIGTGDNLNGKTLYLSFPRDCYTDITNTTEIDIIKVNNSNKISYIYADNKRSIRVVYNNTSYDIYAKNDSDNNPYINYVRYKLPFDFGVVTEIDSNDDIYQYIKFYDDEFIIPNYVKNTWSVNDVLIMRKIDNIEKGIKNIGDYFYKPNGWQTTKDWLGTAELGKNNNYGVNTKNISYLDLNRWGMNLNAITSYDTTNITLWNVNVSQIDWNIDDDVEWEDL